MEGNQAEPALSSTCTDVAQGLPSDEDHGSDDVHTPCRPFVADDSSMAGAGYGDVSGDSSHLWRRISVRCCCKQWWCVRELRRDADMHGAFVYFFYIGRVGGHCASSFRDRLAPVPPSHDLLLHFAGCGRRRLPRCGDAARVVQARGFRELCRVADKQVGLFVCGQVLTLGLYIVVVRRRRARSDIRCITCVVRFLRRDGGRSWVISSCRW